MLRLTSVYAVLKLCLVFIMNRSFETASQSLWEIANVISLAPCVISLSLCMHTHTLTYTLTDTLALCFPSLFSLCSKLLYPSICLFLLHLFRISSWKVIIVTNVFWLFFQREPPLIFYNHNILIYSINRVLRGYCNC